MQPEQSAFAVERLAPSLPGARIGVDPPRRLWHRRALLMMPVLVCCLAAAGGAQQMAPRQWTHLPINTNFLGGGYAYTAGDIAFDPVLRLEGAQVALDTLAVKYIRTFESFGHSARLDVNVGAQEGRWSGLLNGAPARVERSGASDSVVRLAFNLVGGPPLQGDEFGAYRASHQKETLFGLGLAVHLPTGYYLKDKLLNLGSNRYVIRPQVGGLHTNGPWTLEATAGVWFFTENNQFFGGSRLEQDPLYTVQTNLVYTFRPGSWGGVSAGFGYGGESTINGVAKDDRKENLGFGLSAGYQLTPRLSLKADYVAMRPQTMLGVESDTFIVGLSTFWSHR